MRKLVVLAVLASGCNDYRKYCLDQARCEGGSTDTTDCENHFISEQEVADANDCSEERTLYVECVQDHSVCDESGVYTPGTACDALRSDYILCSP